MAASWDRMLAMIWFREASSTKLQMPILKAVFSSARDAEQKHRVMIRASARAKHFFIADTFLSNPFVFVGDEKTPQRAVALHAEAEFPRCHSASLPLGKQSLSRTHDTRRPVTGTEHVAAYSLSFGAPSGVHSSICRAPPSHYRRFPLPWLGRTTLLPRRFDGSIIPSFLPCCQY